MADTLLIHKKGTNKFWHTHNNDVVTKFHVSDFEASIDGDKFNIIQNDGTARYTYLIENISIKVLSGSLETGFTPETFLDRLIAIGYTPYFNVIDVTGLTTDEIDAIHAANNPSASNPFITAVDVSDVVSDADRIIELSTILRVDDTFTFGAGYKWRLAGVNYENLAGIERTIALASSGNKRGDIAVMNNANDIVIVEGPEDAVTTLFPPTPIGTLFLCQFSVDDSSVSDPTDAIAGSQFRKKMELAENNVFGSDNILIVLESEQTTFRLLSDDITFVDGTTPTPTFENTIGYTGMPLIFINSSATNKTFKHSTDVNCFRFPNELDLILKPEEVLCFRMAKTDNVHFEFVSLNRVSGEGSTQTLQEVLTEGNYITKTKSEIDSLISANGLIPFQPYEITEVDSALYGGTTIYVQALNVNTICKEGYGKFYNPKYDKEIAGFGVWDNENTYEAGDKAIWGGLVWENNSGAVGAMLDQYNLNEDWTVVLFDEIDYNVVYDLIKYDIGYDIIHYRNEKGIIIVDCSVASINYLIGTSVNPIKAMQWGNSFDVYTTSSGLKDVSVVSAVAELINFKGAYVDILTVSDNGRIVNNEFKGTSYLTQNIFTNGSYMEACSFIDSSNLYQNTFNNNSIIAAANFAGNSNISNSTYVQSVLQDSSFNNNGGIESCAFINSLIGAKTFNASITRGLFVNYSGYIIETISVARDGFYFHGDLPTTTTAIKVIVKEDGEFKEMDLPVPGSILTNAITNGDTTHAPDGNSVYDALALKAELAGSTSVDFQVPTIPTGANSAASKNYIDNIVTGLSWKTAAKCSTTANHALSGTSNVDGVTIPAGTRVLARFQSAPAQNGIYITAAGAWTRATDCDSASELESTTVFVQFGTLYARTQWTQNLAITTINTDPAGFVLIAGAGTYINGNGLDLSANVFSITSISFGGFISSLTAKNTLVDADTVISGDSAASGEAKKTTWLNIWTNYFKVKSDLLYQAILTDTVFGALINALTGKTTPVDADYDIVMDSADSNKTKKVSLLNRWTNYYKVKSDALYLKKSRTIYQGYTTLTGVTGSQVLVSLLIPGNTYSNTETIEILFSAIKSATAVAIDFNLFQAATINGTTNQITSNASLTIAQRIGTIQRLLTIEGTNTRLNARTSNSALIVTVADSTPTIFTGINWAVDNYISVYVNPTVITEVTGFNFFAIKPISQL
jgi:hypothetical protein